MYSFEFFEFLILLQHFAQHLPNHGEVVNRHHLVDVILRVLGVRPYLLSVLHHHSCLMFSHFTKFRTGFALGK